MSIEDATGHAPVVRVIERPPNQVTDPETGTAYGFEWGPVRVVRLADEPKRGWWFVIQMGHDEVEVHVSENGKRITVVKP